MLLFGDLLWTQVPLKGQDPRLRPSAGGQAGLGRPHGALGVLWGSVPPWDQSWSVFNCVLSRRKGPGAERRGGLWGEDPSPSRLPKHHSLLTGRHTHGRCSRDLSGPGPRSGKWERGRSDSGDRGPTLQTWRPPVSCTLGVSGGTEGPQGYWLHENPIGRTSSQSGLREPGCMALFQALVVGTWGGWGFRDPGSPTTAMKPGVRFWHWHCLAGTMHLPLSPHLPLVLITVIAGTLWSFPSGS